MSSVLIKGMEMPSECEYCGLCRYYPENGNVWCNGKNKLLKQGWKEAHWTHLDVKRPDWCPLIELPEKHGRLIEEPECFYYGGLATISKYDFRTIAEYFAMQVKAQPTIIEAEGDEG